MVQAHIPDDADEGTLDRLRPNCHPMYKVNSYLGPQETPYSEDLIRVLKRFEFRGQKRVTISEPDSDKISNGSGIAGVYTDYSDVDFEFANDSSSEDDGNEYYHDHDDPDEDPDVRHKYDLLPSIRWISNVLLPVAQRKVRRWRGIGRLPANYYDMLDVSWTKPHRIMPYEFKHKPIGGDELEIPDLNPALSEREGIRKWEHMRDIERVTLRYRGPVWDTEPDSPPDPPHIPPPNGGYSEAESEPDDPPEGRFGYAWDSSDEDDWGFNDQDDDQDDDQSDDQSDDQDDSLDDDTFGDTDDDQSGGQDGGKNHGQNGGQGGGLGSRPRNDDSSSSLSPPPPSSPEPDDDKTGNYQPSKRRRR
ncbi:hypothetical protein F5Y11DRAFT_344148 [Daldinia sp. FL1419]|nr:hypothetical protein F5Y11DRAFT_344148 [Daldinia sp. FL1419]